MKPLTKERLEYYNSRDARESDEIEELLSAEAFWREAVKNLSGSGIDSQVGVCDFCGIFNDGGPEHKPDCLWRIAHE